MADLADLTNQVLECCVNFSLYSFPYHAIHTMHILKTDFHTLLQCIYKSTAFWNKHVKLCPSLYMTWGSYYRPPDYASETQLGQRSDFSRQNLAHLGAICLDLWSGSRIVVNLSRTTNGLNKDQILCKLEAENTIITPSCHIHPINV